LPRAWTHPAKKEERAQAEAQAAEDAATFEAIAREWHDRQRNVWSIDHAERILLRLEKHAFPAFGATPLAKLRAPDILPALRDIDARVKGQCGSERRKDGDTGRQGPFLASGLGVC